jgi:hypothetical protein
VDETKKRSVLGLANNKSEVPKSVMNLDETPGLNMFPKNNSGLRF